MEDDLISAIFNQAAVGIAQIETQTGKFARINQKYCDIIGYKQEEMTKSTFMEITHPDDLQEDLDNMEKLKQGLIDEFEMEKRYFHKNGSIVWVLLTVSPLKLPIYHIAVVQDITRRKEAEAEQEKLENELKLQNEKLQLSLHEIKTLRGIIPICSYCHKIRNDEGAWDRLEAYLKKHSDVEFSHGICPSCATKMRAEAGLNNKE